MGNAETKPQVTKSEKANIKKAVVENNVSTIDSLQDDVIESIKNGRIVTRDELVKTVFYSEMAKDQLKKGGSALTKTDLIAIIIKLDGSRLNTIEQLKSLTISDLNIIIRSLIYVNETTSSLATKVEAIANRENTSLTKNFNNSNIKTINNSSKTITNTPINPSIKSITNGQTITSKPDKPKRQLAIRDRETLSTQTMSDALVVFP